MARKPISLTQREPFEKDKRTKIPQETCSKLVSTYTNRLETVIKNKGYGTDFSRKKMEIESLVYEYF